LFSTVDQSHEQNKGNSRGSMGAGHFKSGAIGNWREALEKDS